MTPEERKHAAEVMASEGPWQHRERTHHVEWLDSHLPLWNWQIMEYRVKPEPIVRYVNCYPQVHHDVSNHTRREANLNSSDARIACVRIEFTEGQYDA